MTATTPQAAKATLTDRYIWAVQRSLPEQQRDDIDRELRASIADAIDAKIQAGTDAAAAERETLMELGDPYRLSAGYADRPLHLIGPALFPDFVRLLKLLYAIVLPVSIGGVVLGLLLSQPESVGDVVGPAVATAVGVVVHLGFWTTLVFAIIERGAGAKSVVSDWDPGSLPDLPQAGAVKLGDAVGSAVFLLTMLGLVLWQRFFPLVRAEDGTPLPMLAPALWDLWLPVLFGIAVLEILFALAVFRYGRWTVPFALANGVLAIATAAILIWLFTTDQVINPAWAQELELVELVAPDGVLAVVGAFTAAGIAVWDIVDGGLKTWRQRLS